MELKDVEDLSGNEVLLVVILNPGRAVEIAKIKATYANDIALILVALNRIAEVKKVMEAVPSAFKHLIIKEDEQLVG